MHMYHKKIKNKSMYSWHKWDTHTHDKPLELGAEPSRLQLICGCNTDLQNLGYCTAVKGKKGTSPSTQWKPQVRRRAMITHHALSLPSFLLALSLSAAASESLKLPSLFALRGTAHHVTKHSFLPVWEGAWWRMPSWCGPERDILELYFTYRTNLCVQAIAPENHSPRSYW